MKEAIKYFQNYQEYFWQWETDADAADGALGDHNLLSIPNVGVIAYRNHAMELLKVISEGGIPPFGSFLLVLYASGDFRFSNFDGLNYFLTKIEKKYGGLVDKQAVLQFLKSISQLPDKLKKGENKVLLLHTVFDNCHHRLSAATAAEILKYADSGSLFERCAQRIAFNESAYISDLTTLQLLNSRFPDAPSIVRAMEGLPPIEKVEDEVAEKEAVPAKSFVDLLIEEPKTFEVGNLIRHIWGGLKIPMLHFSPGDQPIGGISDMTNKGNIDRMLLSEFAHDDDVFLQRVANNEALYIQREIPPERNIFERIIIIDISLRNWGTPKLLSLATALAIARHPKAMDECRIFVAAKTSKEIRHDSVEDIISSLALVGPVSDCSEGLYHFFKHDEPLKKREIFLLTAEDSLRHASMQKAISEFREQLKFLISVTTDGTIQFFKMRQGARRLLQTIVLPLGELWKRPAGRKGRALVENQRVYPILFTATANPLGHFYLDKEYYVLSRKKALHKTYLGTAEQNNHYYHNNYRGWEPVVRDISLKPKGSFALGRNEKGELLLCQFHPDDKVLSLLNLSNKEYLSCKYKQVSPYFVMWHDGNFYLFSEQFADCQEISIAEEGLALSAAADRQRLQFSYNVQQKEVHRSLGYTRDVLTNHHSVGITDDGLLHFSKHSLVLQHGKLVLRNMRPGGFVAVAVRNGRSFSFDDGSVVLVDPDGMITLRSSDLSLPDVYIPSCLGVYLAAATMESFCGSEYYLPQQHQFSIESEDSFYEKYIKTFIQQILGHAGKA